MGLEYHCDICKEELRPGQIFKKIDFSKRFLNNIGKEVQIKFGNPILEEGVICDDCLEFVAELIISNKELM